VKTRDYKVLLSFYPYHQDNDSYLLSNLILDQIQILKKKVCLGFYFSHMMGLLLYKYRFLLLDKYRFQCMHSGRGQYKEKKEEKEHIIEKQKERNPKSIARGKGPLPSSSPFVLGSETKKKPESLLLGEFSLHHSLPSLLHNPTPAPSQFDRCYTLSLLTGDSSLCQQVSRCYSWPH
jgi:hypothetical protein